jgi:hypothetical protein
MKIVMMKLKMMMNSVDTDELRRILILECSSDRHTLVFVLRPWALAGQKTILMSYTRFRTRALCIRLHWNNSFFDEMRM